MRTALITALCFMALPGAMANEPANDADWIISKTDLSNPIDDSMRGYTSRIHRSFRNENEKRLLDKAEAVYPKREVVLNAMKIAHFKTEKAPAGDEPLWWSSAFDQVRIPYAITASAVRYYDNQISAFGRGDFSGSGNIPMKAASLEYSSSINYRDKWAYETPKVGRSTSSPTEPTAGRRQFSNVYVVEMTLRWSQYCGSECAMSFHKERVVVLDKNGNVLAVFGDGNTPATVS